MINEKYLTKKWNNRLTILLGIPILIIAYLSFCSPILSAFNGFIIMVILGAVY